MREIDAQTITDTVARLAVEATHQLPEDVEGAIRAARDTERSPLGVQIIDEILENAEIARTRM
jgi:fumarate hydratase subunit alpha